MLIEGLAIIIAARVLNDSNGSYSSKYYQSAALWVKVPSKNDDNDTAAPTENFWNMDRELQQQHTYSYRVIVLLVQDVEPLPFAKLYHLLAAEQTGISYCALTFDQTLAIHRLCCWNVIFVYRLDTSSSMND